MNMIFSQAALVNFDENYRNKVKPEHGESSRSGYMEAEGNVISND